MRRVYLSLAADQGRESMRQKDRTVRGKLYLFAPERKYAA